MHAWFFDKVEMDMGIWELIRKCVKDIEMRNNIVFEDSAWERFKLLERDLIALFYRENVSQPPGTEEEIDAFLRAHGYNPDKLKADIRAKLEEWDKD